MKHLSVTVLAALPAFVLFALALSAAAQEINYGHIEEIRGDTVLLEYKGPAGTQYFTCDIDDGDCADKETRPQLYEPINGLHSYPHNQQGTYAVRQFILGSDAYYILYDISGDKPEKLGRLPATVPMANISFTDSGDVIMFLDTHGNVRRYDITDQKLSAPFSLPGDRPFFSISHDGNWAASYSYTLPGHRLWHIPSGRTYSIGSDQPSYVEFSQDETHAAYLDDRDGYRTLFEATLSSLADGNVKHSQITAGATEVEDYLYAGDTLYYLANPNNPLIWNLYAYDGEDSQLVARDISYGDFLKYVDGKLSFLKVTGKNSDVYVVDPNDNTVTKLDAVEESPTSSKVDREIVYVGERYGALISPADAEARDDADTLFVWLHGGPQRQTSLGFHSYLSYAVYDELLETIAEAGNYVLKLDYTGSTGYGDKFREALHRKVGVVDVKDVNNAVAELEEDLGIKNVYVIGNSYGGYLALKTLADDPDRFTGAISINGVSDWYGLIARIPSSPFSKIFEGAPDLHNLDAYMSANVFTGLDQATKENKALIVYGENDSTVPTWQSTQYLDYAATKNLTVDSLTLEEDHIIRQRSSLEKLCSKIEDFFELEGVGCL